MVTEIWSATDRIFCHFGLFSALLPSKNPGKFFFEKKNKNKKNKKTKTTTTKKTPGDIILHMYTINENHMIHGSWDMECNKQPEK